MILDGEEFVTETLDGGSNFVEINQEDGRKRKKLKEDIGLMTKIVSSGGHEFEVHKVPVTHEIMLSSELSRRRNLEQQLKDLGELLPHGLLLSSSGLGTVSDGPH